MGTERRIVTIEGGGPWLRPFVRPSRRSGRYIWFEDGAADLAPGQTGKFEIERERVRGAQWRVVKRIES